MKSINQGLMALNILTPIQQEALPFAAVCITDALNFHANLNIMRQKNRPIFLCHCNHALPEALLIIILWMLHIEALFRVQAQKRAIGWESKIYWYRASQT